MRFTRTIFGLATSACLTLTPAYADSHGRPAVATQHAHAPQTTGKPTISGKPTVSGKPTISGKPTTSGKPAITTKPISTGKPSPAMSPTKGSKKAPTTSPTTHATTTSPRLNPIAQKISSHPQKAAKVQALLPAGMTLNQASRGFKNQGQFLAALHVSRNLGIPFSKLKADMTGRRHLSLGQAIQFEKARANATTEVHRAETEANDDLRTTTTTTTSPTRRTDEDRTRRTGEDRTRRTGEDRTGRTETRTSPTRLNPIALKISSHPALAARVQALLPAGMTLNQASKGFKNQGQFLAALHVSQNLGIPFAQLRAEMTGRHRDSLGAAIQELRQGTNANAAVGTAERQADADVKATTPQSARRQGDKDGDD
jgi:hypothetical protein